MSIFDTIFYKPLFNILILFYQYIPGHDFGVAIILLTVSIRFLLYPLGATAIKSQKVFQDIQPKIKEIQKKYKDDKEKQMQATLELYKEAKINPFSSLLPLLIQLPILYALYRVFWKGLNAAELVNIYGFVPKPESINSVFVGFMSLDKPNLILAVLCGITQFFQVKMLTPTIKKGEETDRFSAMLQKQTLYFFPAIIVLMLFRIPSAIGLYWLTTTIFSIIQQYVTLKFYVKQR
jgi:YidC/Oxa1 family membrane protein insertase